jgi:HK97 family phage portal protein
MRWRWEALKAGVTGKAENLQRFFSSRWTEPPDRNTAEFLKTYTHNPRLSPVTKISTDLASVPGTLYRIKKSGEREEIPNHPFLDFMANPNPLPHITRTALWKLMEQYLLIKGEGASIIERDRAGYPMELWPVPPNWIMDIPRLGYPYYVIRSRDGRQMPVEAADVFMMRQLNPVDPYSRGLGESEAITDELETDEYMAKFAKRFFYNDATPPTIISAPGLTPDERDKFNESWKERHRGINNAHKIAVVNRELTVQKLVSNQREMDFATSRKDLRDAVNAHFAVPPEILGIVENSNRATAMQAKIIYAENVLMPRLEARQNAINSQLLSAWGEDLYYEFEDIVPQDQEFALQQANDGLKNSAIMVDEWREQNGYELLPDNKGQILYVPYSILPTKPEELTQTARENETQTSPATAPQAEDTPSDIEPKNKTEDVEQLEVAKDIALNGAQISSLMQIVQSVTEGGLGRESAIEIITAAFPYDREKAEQILGEAKAATEKRAERKASNTRRLQAAHRDRVRILNETQRKAKPQVDRFLTKQLDDIFKAMNIERKDKSDDFWAKLTVAEGMKFDIDDLRTKAMDALEHLIDWPEQDAALNSTLSPVWESAFEAGANSTKDGLGIEAISAPKMTDHMREQGFKRVSDINETTRKELARSLADGIEAGEGQAELIKRIQEHMPDVQAGRASAIVNCETHTSMQSGSFEQMKYGGIKTKTWITAGDDNVRANHAQLNGQTVPIDKPFSNGLMFPGDPAGSAGEIIGCRCDLLPGDF